MRQQHTQEVLLVIDGWLSGFVTAPETDRSSKIDAIKALADYQLQLGNHIIQCETIDSEFTVVLSQMVDWFFDNYSSMIDEIDDAVISNFGDIEQYLLSFSLEIDNLSELFAFVPDEPEDDDDESGEPDGDFGDESDEPEDDFGDEIIDDRMLKAGVFAELGSLHEVFFSDDFISLKISSYEMLVGDLGGLIGFMASEGIVDSERLDVLSGRINSLFETYNDINQTIAFEASSILDKFDMEIFSQTVWFEEHYSWLVDEIAGFERIDEFDGDTVSAQIEELELVKLYMVYDGVVGADFCLSVSEQIDVLIEEYEGELVLIADRIVQRDIDAAAAAAAATSTTSGASSGAARPSGSSGSSGGGSGSNSGSSGSGSGSGSSSATPPAAPSTPATPAAPAAPATPAAPSTSPTIPMGTNNNYPSISSDCRELLARLVKLEAPNESANGKQAVAEVVLNRMVSSRWSHVNTVEEVIFDTKWGVQFTVKDLIWTDKGNPATADYSAVDRAFGGSNVLSKDYMFFASRAVTQNDVVWIGAHAFSK